MRDVSGTTVAKKPWALLAYTVADDKGGGGSLDAAAKDELKAICDAADFGRVSVAAQVDFRHTRGVFRGSLTSRPPKSRDFEDVRAENHPLWRKILGGVDPSTLRVQRERQDLNAANASVLEEFFRFGRKECPADRYAISFYGHAYGPMGMFYDKEAGRRDPHTLRLNDLAQSIERADGRAAVVMFRDCFMSTLETASQIADVAEFMIGSQAEMPIAGIWPWLNFMAALMPSADSADVARALAMQLGRFLDEPANRGPFADVPISLIDVRAVDNLTGPLKALADALEDARRNDHRRRACAAALEAARVGFPDDRTHPGDPALLDVPLLCENLIALGTDPVTGPANALRDVVGSRLVAWHHSQTGRFHGVSIYYKPVRPMDLERSYIQAESDDDAKADADAYAQLALSHSTGWHRIALNPLALALLLAALLLPALSLAA
jgi:Clostripain family